MDREYSRAVIPKPLDHLANWPTLVLCPHCSASLSRSSEQRGRCRICGFAYDEQSFSLPVWTTINAHSPPWAFAGLHHLLFSGGALTLFWVAMTTDIWQLVIAGVIALYLSWLLRPKTVQNAALIVGVGGVAVRVHRNRRIAEVPWGDCERIVVRTAVDDDGNEHDGVFELAICRRRTHGHPAFAEVVVLEQDMAQEVADRLRDILKQRENGSADSLSIQLPTTGL